MSLNEIKEYFKVNEPPNKQIQLNCCTKILKPKTFVEMHIRILEVNPGNKTYMPYYERLIDFIGVLES